MIAAACSVTQSGGETRIEYLHFADRIPKFALLLLHLGRQAGALTGDR
jgi:hypothetical protein